MIGNHALHQLATLHARAVQLEAAADRECARCRVYWLLLSLLAGVIVGLIVGMLLT